MRAGAPSRAAEAITAIRSSAVIYFTSVGGDDALVIIVDGHSGPYLRTDPDASVANNLDALPDCRKHGSTENHPPISASATDAGRSACSGRILGYWA